MKTSIVRLGVVAALVSALALATTTTSSAQEPIPPTRVTEQAHADPTVVEIGGEFWSYATYCCVPGADGRKVAARRAASVEGPYEYAGNALTAIPWVSNDFAIYAPDVHYFSDSRIVLYFAAVPGNPAQEGNRCIGAAISTSGPAGPFVPQAQPILCAPNLGGAIDPSYFRDPVSGRTFLLYKTNSDPSDSRIRRIWLQEMSADGLRPVGTRLKLAERTTNIENPELVYSGQRYFLFVSRDLYRTSNYKTSVLVSVQVGSGYANERAVLTAQNTNVSGPGGADVLRTSDGRTIAYHHGWIGLDGRCDGYRPMYVSELAWDVNGRLPHLAQPTPGNPSCNV
jgi:beta-xylosidase